MIESILDQWEHDPAARLAGMLRARESRSAMISRDRESIPPGHWQDEWCGCRTCARSRQVRVATARLMDLWYDELDLPSHLREDLPSRYRYPRTPEAVRAFFEAEAVRA